MPIFMNRLDGLCVTSPSTEVSDNSITDTIIENYLQNEEIFRVATIESIVATYNGIKANNSNIVYEGFRDMKDKIVQWFKNFINFFKKHFRKFMTELLAIFGDTERLIKKYKDELPNFGEFDMEGNEYSIDPKPVKIESVLKIVDELNNAVDKLADMSPEEYNKAIMSGNSDEYYDNIRGEVIGCGHKVTDGDFRTMVKSSFRNGNEGTILISCDANMISKMCEWYFETKKALSACKTDESNMEKLTNSIIEFAKTQPSIAYNKDDMKVMRVHKLSVDDNKNVSHGESSERRYNETVQKRMAGYYAKKISMLKRIQQIYAIYMTMKLEAIREAISFYSACIRKTFNSENKVKTKNDKDKQEEAKESFLAEIDAIRGEM